MRHLFVDEQPPLIDKPSFSFRCLESDTNQYSTLILQPCGAIEVADVVRNADRSLALVKHVNFLQLAKATKADLVVTPEYSCPWDAVHEALAEDILPESGSLWILGCEGIAPKDLAAFKTAHPDVVWIEDPSFNPVSSPGKYLDPVCALFTLDDGKSGHSSTIAVLQYKCQEMADKNTRFEPDNLIRGQSRFVFRNRHDPNSVQLVTLICSDTLGNVADEDWYREFHRPWLIVHIQLCVAPRHHDFIAYRQQPLQHNAEHTEFLAVNWARGFRVSDATEDSRYGGSAIFSKAPQADLSDDRLSANQVKGMYYAWCHEHRTHIYPWNYEEHAFLFFMHKASQKSAKASAQANGRTGPELQRTYEWSSSNGNWIEAGRIDHGFKAAYDGAGCKFDLGIIRNLNPIDQERLILLSTATIDATVGPRWHHAKRLLSVSTDRREMVRRITFGHDPETQSFRKRVLANFGHLADIISSTEIEFPVCIRDLKSGSELTYKPHECSYDHNLFGTETNSGATVAYIGMSTRSEAEAAYANLQRAIDDEKRLVVWFSAPAGLGAIVDHVEPLITDGSEERDGISRQYGS